MQKLIATLGVMALLMFFQETARSVVATAADPFHAQGTTYGRFCLLVYKSVIALEADIGEYTLLASGVGLFAFVFGWMTHQMLHQRGFGTLANCAVGLAGAAAAIVLYYRFGGELSPQNYRAVIAVGLAGAFGSLGVATLLKPVIADAPGEAAAASVAEVRAQQRLTKVASRK